MRSDNYLVNPGTSSRDNRRELDFNVDVPASSSANLIFGDAVVSASVFLADVSDLEDVAPAKKSKFNPNHTSIGAVDTYDYHEKKLA